MGCFSLIIQNELHAKSPSTRQRCTLILYGCSKHRQFFSIACLSALTPSSSLSLNTSLFPVGLYRDASTSALVHWPQCSLALSVTTPYQAGERKSTLQVIQRQDPWAEYLNKETQAIAHGSLIWSRPKLRCSTCAEVPEEMLYWLWDTIVNFITFWEKIGNIKARVLCQM